MAQPNVCFLVELFHLSFLQQLNHLTAKNLYAVKGGCNLRFFANSPRYSEDLDIDIHTVAKETLAKKVDKIWQSARFKQLIGQYGLTIVEASTPKQTDTTQRWKLHLAAEDVFVPLHTKIEFSRRKKTLSGVEYAAIGPALCAHYGMPAMLLPHYDLQSAFIQKIKALAGRTETQARDVFDLYHLLTQQFDQRIGSSTVTAEEAAQAITNLKLIEFSQFNAQVVGFLDAVHQQQYADEMIWLHLCDEVEQSIKALAT